MADQYPQTVDGFFSGGFIGKALRKIDDEIVHPITKNLQPVARKLSKIKALRPVLKVCSFIPVYGWIASATLLAMDASDYADKRRAMIKAAKAAGKTVLADGTPLAKAEAEQPALDAQAAKLNAQVERENLDSKAMAIVASATLITVAIGTHYARKRTDNSGTHRKRASIRARKKRA